jgi:hypothetical protein
MTGSARRACRLLNRILTLLALAMPIVSGPAMSEPAIASPPAAIAAEWELPGSWALDCSLPPDHDRGARFNYRIANDGRLVLVRDFGDTSDINDVLDARTEPDGSLRLTVNFPAFGQIRTYTLTKDGDGNIRAMSNRDDKGRYSIRNGRFSATGQPTPKQARCD